MSAEYPKTKEPYLGVRGKGRSILDDYQENQVDFAVDSGTGNLLVTGRPNSGIEDFKELLIEKIKATEVSYLELTITSTTDALKAIKEINTPGRLVIIEDPYRILFSVGGIKKPDNMIYFTRHWNLRTDSYEYAVFDHHIAFASARNQDITEYPSGFAAVGSDLKHGEYVSIDTGSFSTVSKTTLN